MRLSLRTERKEARQRLQVCYWSVPVVIAEPDREHETHNIVEYLGSSHDERDAFLVPALFCKRGGYIYIYVFVRNIRASSINFSISAYPSIHQPTSCQVLFPLIGLPLELGTLYKSRRRIVLLSLPSQCLDLCLYGRLLSSLRREL